MMLPLMQGSFARTHVRVLSPACSGFGLRGYTCIPFGRMKPQHARESVLWCLCDSRTRSATERSDDVRVGHFRCLREGGELIPSHALGLVESLAKSLTHDPAVLPTAREVVPLGWLLRPRGGLRLGLRTRGGFRLRGRCRWCRRCTREKGEELIHFRVVVRELGFERSDTLGVGNACHGGSLSPACSGAYRETIALRAGDEDEQGGVPPTRESRVRGSGVEAEHVVEAADHHSAGVIEVAVAVLRPRDETLEVALLVPLARFHAGRIQQGLGGFHERVERVSLRVTCHWDGSLCSGKKAESYYGDDPYTILGLS